MMRRVRLATLLAVPLLFVGCEQCEKGFKIKTEYQTVFWTDYWHDSPKDTLLDGAIRTSTWTSKRGRTLTIRCFRFRAGKGEPSYDLRFKINVPLLARLGPDIKDAGIAELVVNVDGTAIGIFEARPITHDDGISFLADVDAPTVEELAAAEDSIITMPRQEGKKLDQVIEFGVTELVKHLKPVKAACAELHKPEQPTRTPLEN
jgi:hypothetical protein